MVSPRLPTLNQPYKMIRSFQRQEGKSGMNHLKSKVLYSQKEIPTMFAPILW